MVASTAINAPHLDLGATRQCMYGNISHACAQSISEKLKKRIRMHIVAQFGFNYIHLAKSPVDFGIGSGRFRENSIFVIIAKLILPWWQHMLRPKVGPPFMNLVATLEHNYILSRTGGVDWPQDNCILLALWQLCHPPIAHMLATPNDQLQTQED
ncbi:uncharacterized protein LOC117573191 [Drosophila albomicans]|uniref:Uncharacterized protein LOC117573191 n=1 Tax=Drosophila albomicans TaxID=7291 RepID=A0A6P8X7C3_DROAB|nr:uncharacterized protein LOC117573191 [Drosophila albomicans]